MIWSYHKSKIKSCDEYRQEICFFRLQLTCTFRYIKAKKIIILAGSLKVKRSVSKCSKKNVEMYRESNVQMFSIEHLYHCRNNTALYTPLSEFVFHLNVSITA